MCDHLFISYATEDWSFVEWLTRQLTARGYRVWCDRFKLLGGESYPKDIDLALKTGTFRVLGILSRSSINKPNPVKERTMALNLAKSLGVNDFLIRINLDGLKPSELDWMTADITFIPFYESWAAGLRQLFSKLESVNTPRPLVQGRQIAIASFLPGPILSSSPEYLSSNLLPIARCLQTVKKISLVSPITRNERVMASKIWPHWFLSEQVLLAFQQPPSPVFEGERIRLLEELTVVDQQSICGIQTENLISSLLDKSIKIKCLQKGLRQTPDYKMHYFPSGLLQGNRVTFQSYKGKLAWVWTVGQRSYRKGGITQKYNYHLAVKFRVRRDIQERFYVQMVPTVYFTDLTGNALPDRMVASKRKQISRAWRNHEWHMRFLALISFLSDGTGEIVIGHTVEESVHIATQSVRLLAPTSIDESALQDASPYESFDDEHSEEDATDIPAEVEDSSD